MTLVLMPGMDGTGRLFEPFIDALQGEFAIKVLSYPDSGPQDYAHLGALAADALPVEGPLVLLGESFSGPLAIMLAAAHPSRVAGVVLCCTFARNPRPMARLPGLIASGLPVPLPPARVMNHFLLGRFQTAPLRKALDGALACVAPTALRARLKAVLSVAVTEEASRISSPVLYLRASADRLVPDSACREVAKYCRHLAVESIDGPHCLLQAAPIPAAHQVARFVRGLKQAKSTSQD